MGPMLDLDNLGMPKAPIVHSSREEELTFDFQEGGKWVGIIMSIGDFRKYIWSNKEDLSENTVVYAIKYDKHRRKAIKHKVESNIRINGEQLDIEDYYVTSNKGYIAWVKTDSRLVAEIHWRAAKSALSSFRTTLYVPKSARDRKTSIDRLLMGYKRDNDDFRYLVRNDAQDLKVLIKRISEGERVPYRPIALNVLGRLSPLKTILKATPSDDNREEDDDVPEGFTLTESSKKKENYIDKDTIYKNITSILNGFSTQEETQRRR